MLSSCLTDRWSHIISSPYVSVGRTFTSKNLIAVFSDSSWRLLISLMHLTAAISLSRMCTENCCPFKFAFAGL
jgi:hypothetical protein